MKKPILNHSLPKQPGRWGAASLGVVWALAMLLGGGPGFPVSSVEAATVSKSGGLTITSDRMELDDKRRTAIFFGHVRAQEKRMALSSDKMTVNYHKRDRRAKAVKKGTSEHAEQIIAEIRAVGHVELVQGAHHGTAEEMIYRVEKQTLERLGRKKNATIRYGKDRLEGKRIFLTIADDHSISKISVQGGKKRRVSARILPPEESDGMARPPIPQKTARPTSKSDNRP